MSTKLYVGNLPYSATGDQLSEMFAKAGAVTSAVVITDRMSGRSKGFGFVEMTSDSEAKKAVELFNETDMEGRKIVVNEARPRRDDAGAPAGAPVEEAPAADDLK
jgi:RNA recognition motif-containing protein